MHRARVLLATFLVASASLAALAPAAQAASVTPEDAQLPVALVGASAVAFDGRTYMFGGRDPNGTYSDEVRVYDGRTVQTVARLPLAPGDAAEEGRYSGAAAAIGDRIYYFGGAQLVMQDINGDGTQERVPKASRDIIEFDPATGTARITGDRLPLGAWGMSVVVAGGTAYLFGGFTFDIADLANTGRHDWVLRYDTSMGEGSTQRLRELDAKLPYAVQDSAAAILGRRAFIIGGLSDHDPEWNPCPTYTYYDPQTGREETKQIEVCLTKRIVSFDITYGGETMIGVAGELPYRAQFITAAVVDGKAYIAGAHLSDGTASSSIVEISLVRDVAQSRVIVPVLPRGAFGQAVATDGQTILAFGGRTGGDRDLTTEIVRIDPRTTAPWSPRSAVAQEIPGGVRLTWDAPSYNGDSVVTGYRIYRSSPSEPETRLAETTSLSYEDKTVRPGTEYVWRIAAVNSAGESAQAARVSRSSGTVPPGPVAVFAAEAGNGEVVLEWRPPTETGGANLTGYRILRNGDQLLIVTDLSQTKYVDRTVQNGMTYVYQIVARNAKGDGTPSESIRVTPAPGPAAPTGVVAEVVQSGDDSVVRVSWLPTGDRYHVYRGTVPARPGELVAENLTSTTYLDALVERGRTYYYRVAALNDVGDSPRSEEAAVSLVRKPGAPTDVTALGMEGEIRLSWTPPVDTGDAPAANLRYSIARGTAGQTPRPYKTDVDGTVLVDRLVTPGVEYTYTVTTLNPMVSDASATANATAKTLPKRAPVALLSALPPVASAGDPIELDASQSSDIDGAIVRYVFDFGDGTDVVTSDKPTITHAYARNGTWTASVVVMDSDNLPSEAAQAQVIIGEVIRELDQGLPGGSRGNARTESPGSESPAIPGPAPLLVLAFVALAAATLRQRR